MDAQKAQIRTASVAIGIEPKSARNGGSVRVLPDLTYHSALMARPGATHRAAAPSCTPATRDRTGRLHRDVHGRPAACRNPGLLDDSGLASASRPRIARGPQAPGGSPAIPEPGPRARRHPGVPAGLPFTPCAV